MPNSNNIQIVPVGNSAFVTIPEYEDATDATISFDVNSKFFSITAGAGFQGIEKGDYIVNIANEVVYEIAHLNVDKVNGRIEGTFDNTVAGGTFGIIKKKDVRAISASIVITAANVSINGTNMPVGTKNLSTPDENASVGLNNLCPITVSTDGTGAAVITVQNYI